MVEMRYLVQKGRVGGHTTHYYIPPDDSGLWLQHKEIGYFMKLQYRHKIPTSYTDMFGNTGNAYHQWSEWTDVPVNVIRLLPAAFTCELFVEEK